jgi:ABC-type multidrug transport system fused ATPase/permease subunit
MSESNTKNINDVTEEHVVNVTDENITLKTIMNRYFIPPKTIEYYKWGQAIVIFIFFGLMFVGILFAYVYANFTDYQNRISVITNAYLFGKDPEGKFEQYMRNSQGEIISTVMNDIKSSAMNLETVNARLDSAATRLDTKVQTEVPKKYVESNSLGVSIQQNIAKLRDTISKMGGAFVLGNYVKDGAINTVKS